MARAMIDHDMALHSRHRLSRRLLGMALGGAILAGVSATAWGQTASPWPVKTVRIVVNAPAGGSIDAVTRLVAERLEQRLGSTVVVENKAGGSGLIGLRDVLRAPADGSTFLASLDGVLTEVPHSVKLNFDPLKDLTPLADFFINGWVLTTSSEVPAKSYADLLAWAKATPDGVNYGSFSAGTISHILGLQLARTTGIRMNHVPFRGGADAMQALLGGHIQMLFSGVVQAQPHLKSGKISVIAFSGDTRSEFLPEVPTFKELGNPDLTAESWVGLWSRSTMPAALRERMHNEVAAILALPEMREKIRALGTHPAVPRSSAALAKQMAIDSPRAGAVLRAAGVQPQ